MRVKRFSTLVMPSPRPSARRGARLADSLAVILLAAQSGCTHWVPISDVTSHEARVDITGDRFHVVLDEAEPTAPGSDETHGILSAGVAEGTSCVHRGEPCTIRTRGLGLYARRVDGPAVAAIVLSSLGGAVAIGVLIAALTGAFARRTFTEVPTPPPP